jgi:hypothetical protein
VQRHLGGDVLRRLHLEVRGAHPRFDRAEWVFDGLAAQRYPAGIIVETLLDSLEDVLVLPPFDAAFLARRAPVLDGAALTAARPIAAQRLAGFLVRVMIDELLSSRTHVGILS